MSNTRTALINVLTGLMLVMTLCLVVFYGLVAADVYNPFPVPTRASLLPITFDTPTPEGPTEIPTWTPTAQPTATSTSPPAGTRTPTGTRTVTPTFRPTDTSVPPTPRVTRAPWPFTCEVDFRRPEYGTPWSGVAGHLQDLDGVPLPGFYAQVECCQGCGIETVQAGGKPFYVNIYSNQAAWEVACDATGYVPLEVRVQMYDSMPNEEGAYPPVSEQTVIQLGGYAGTSLAYLTCTLNWQDWLPPTPTPTETPVP
jgi:hypothetical protein